MSYKVRISFCFVFQYDATVPGGFGGGGEYDVQKGFGWSNGVVINLLWRYSDKLTVEDATVPLQPEERNAESSSSMSSITTALIMLLVSLTAGFLG